MMEVYSSHLIENGYRTQGFPAPWKFLLPVLPGKSILAIGLGKNELESLGRSWDRVYVDGCREQDIQFRCLKANGGETLNCLERLDYCKIPKESFYAIAVGPQDKRFLTPEKASWLLEPGGSVIWIGRHSEIPSAGYLSEKGFEVIGSYALVPPETGRILLPVSNTFATEAALRLYTPGKLRNRLAVRVAKLATSVNLQGVVIRNNMIAARKPGRAPCDAYFIKWISSLLGKEFSDLTIYTGSNQANGLRKFTIQLIEGDGRANIIAKIADTTPAVRALLRELNTLKRLEGVPELRNAVPRIIAAADWQGHYVIIQTALTPNKVKYITKLNTSLVTFLLILSQIDRLEMTLEKWPHWGETWEWAHKNESNSLPYAGSVGKAIEACYRSLHNVKIPFHRVHGDFAPWNVLLGSEKMAVIDWEDSEALGLPLSDMIHFATRVNTQLKKRNLPLEQLIYRWNSALGIARELKLLMNSPQLKSLLSYTRVQIDSLVNLSILRDHMEAVTGLSFADIDYRLENG